MIKFILLLCLGLGSMSHAAEKDKDRGGGNGYKGRPLESYVKDITQFKEFQTIVAPAIENLRKKVPTLAEDLLRVANLKNWFFVPVRLPEIPSERIGVTFKTDQYALQSIKEIWFDDDLYKGMTQDSYRAMILMHELVMGLKLSSFYTLNSYCSATNYSSSCQLTRSDYESVRGLSIMILKTQDKFTVNEIKKYLADNHFGEYKSNSDLNHLSTFSVANVFRLLRSEKLMQSLPTVGRDGSSYGCGYEFNLSEDRSMLEVKIHRTVGNDILRDYLPLRVVVDSAPAIVVQKGTASFQYATPVANPIESVSYRRKIEIFITPERVTRITAYWEIYDFDYRSNNSQWKKELKGPGGFEPSQRICEY
jgi:hypothetical protein